MAMTDASVVAAYLVVAAHPDDYRVASEVHALLECLARTVAGRTPRCRTQLDGGMLAQRAMPPD